MDMEQELPVLSTADNVDFYWSQLKDNLTLGNFIDGMIELNGVLYASTSYLDPSARIGLLHRFDKLENVPDCASIRVDPGHGLCSGIIEFDDNIVCTFDDGFISAYDSNLALQEQQQISHSYITRLVKCDRSIIVGDYNSCLMAVDVETFKPTSIVTHLFDGFVSDVLTKPDGVLLVAGSDGSILLWDNREDNELCKMATAKALAKISSQPTRLQWASSSQMQFYLATETGNVVRFDIRNWNVISKKCIFPNQPIHLLEPLESNQTTIMAASSESSNRVRFYDADLDVCLHQQTYETETNIRSLLHLSNGQIVVAGSQSDRPFCAQMNLKELRMI